MELTGRRAAALTLATFVLAACASTAPPPSAPGPATDHAGLYTPGAVSRQVTICFSGRSMGDDAYASGGNSELGSLCRRLPNLVRDVGGPDAAYPFFRWNSDVGHAVDVLAASLDSADPDIAINVIGFSWGGFNARDLVEKVAADRRFVARGNRVTRLFALDPYRTDALVFARKPPNVVEYWEFRHSAAPAHDCSRIFGGLIGPFTGRPPSCRGATVCHDLDYSLDPATKSVDHCEIPARASESILLLVGGHEATSLPPERRVKRR